MKWFRNKLSENRIFILALVALNLFLMVDGRNLVYAYQVHEQKEERLKEISELLDIPVEKLRPDHETLFESIKKLFVEEKDPVKEAGLKRLQAVLKKHEEQLAANPYLPQIEEVKREHAIYRIEGMVQDLMQLTQPKNGKALPEASQRALLRSLHHGLKERPELPPLPEGLPAKARAKHAEMQTKLDRLFDSVRPIVAETQEPEMKGTLAQKIEALARFQGVGTKRSVRPPRFADRPLPLRRVEKKARTLEASSAEGEPVTKGSARASARLELPRVAPKAGIAPEIVELAESLGNSPAKIFGWVHDNVDFDPKWGAFNGPLGTLWEKSGTSWDQAWLLRDLLVAAGVDARFEWGEIEISTDLLTNVTGLDDPFRAGDLLTTAGVPIVLLVQGSQVIAARMSHVWVKAFVDYVPNRGATPGPGDTWIQMDPSLKRSKYAAGIRVHPAVPFSLGAYLQSGTALSPRRAHEDALWAYIQANDLACTTLEQLKQAGSVVAEDFPFLPGSLRGKILQVDGEGTDVPAALQERVRLEVRTASGGSLLSWESLLPVLFGQRIELVYEGATPDDQAVLDTGGGVFETAPFLVDLKPVVRVGGVQQAAGSAIGSAEDVEIFVTLTPANGAADVLVHNGFAGEPSVLITDFGRLPQQLLDRYQAAILAAQAAGDDAGQEQATLQMIGATYMHNLGRDLEDLAGWNWHRLVRLVTEGLIAQTGTVTTSLAGTPISFTRAERFVDIATMTLGLFHTEGDTSFLKSTLELAGAQGSFLEGEVFNQVVEREGIAAVSALTRAQREGQVLTLVDGANVDAVLARVDLDPDVEEQVRIGVAQGKLAWVPEERLSVNLWTGVGFILEDPATGTAAYLLNGGFAGGSDTGRAVGAAKALGDETWLSNGPLGIIISILLSFLGGDPGDDDDPESNQGDPVNMANGNLWRTETDITVQARGLPILWSRTYNSQSTFKGPLGFGWTWSYGESLTEEADGTVLYREADGSEHLFVPDGASFVSPAGKHLTLSRDAQGFVLRTKHAQVSRFNSAGQLVSINDPNGNTLTLGYDASGSLNAIIDAAGRTVLDVTALDGKITEVRDLTGRRVLYGYTGDDLTSVTDVRGETWSFTYDSDHNLTSRSNPLGETDSFVYDGFDRLIRHVNPLGDQEHFAYSHRGQRAVITDVRGFDRYLEFDEQGRATLETDALGNARRSTWDAENNRTTTTNPRGGVTTRTFDAQGNLTSETDPLGASTSWTYDPVFNRVLTATDALGHTVTSSYDERGNLLKTTQVVDGQSVVREFVYDALGQVLETQDANGNPTTVTWNSQRGVVETLTDATGATTRVGFDTLGRLASLEDPEGNLTSLGYDEQGNITSIEDPFARVTRIDYDAAGRQTTMTNPLGTTTIEYDAAGRAVVFVDALGQRLETLYDAAGHVIARTDERGATTTTTYDAAGRRLTVTDPSGSTWRFGYCGEIGSGQIGRAEADPEGSFCELTDPLGRTLRRDYDELGRVTRVIDPLGNVTRFEYDALSREVRTVDPLGRETRFEYDQLGELKAVIEANGARTEYTWDPARNLVRIRDAEGRTWTRTYDARNRLQSQSDPLGHTTSFFYDGLDNLVRMVKPDGQEITYEYYVSRRIATVLPDQSRETYTYDTSGRRIAMANSEASLSYTYDALNHLTEVRNHVLDKSIRYEYDPSGNLTRLATAQGTVEYFYDERGLLREQRDSVTGTYRFDYDALGQRTKLFYPNGIETTYIYDEALRLTGLLSRGALGALVDAHSYTYDNAGNRISKVALSDGVTDTYEYDAVNRLSRFQRGPDRFEEFTYDRVGNRLTLTDDLGTTSYSYDAANRILDRVRTLSDGSSVGTTYTSDANGNLVEVTSDSGTTTRYRWNALNRLMAVDTGTSVYGYGYDANGVRVRETQGGDTRHFFHSPDRRGFGEIIGVFDAQSEETTYFVHGPGIDEPLAQKKDGETHYIHRDGRWSVTALSSADGQRSGSRSYTPFGEVEDSQGPESRFGFTSRELDPTGLMYYRARYYQSSLGRFLSRDTFEGHVRSPASQHDFTYVENNPVSMVDPSGRFGLIARVIAVAVGILMGAVIGRSFFWFKDPALNIFWGAFVGAVVSLVLVTAAGSFFKLGENIRITIDTATRTFSRIEWTTFIANVGKFFAVHYSRHKTVTPFLHIHIGKGEPLTGWVAILITGLLVTLVLVAVFFFFYSLAVLFYE